jgi:threonine synthase
MHFQPVCDECERPASLEDMTCAACGGKISFTYDHSHPIIDNSKKGLTRFWSRLPLVNPEQRVTLGEGNTPLINFTLNGFTNLYVKNEMGNPTGSHKDRQLSLAISHALAIHKKVSVLASAGSTGLANSAYAARAGIKSIVFTGSTARTDRVYPIHVLGSKVVTVNADIDEVLDTLTPLCNKLGIYHSSTARYINPYQAEGPKTMSYEIFEQLGKAPDWVIVPTGGGGTYSAMARGFIELYDAGLTDRVPQLIGSVPANYNAIEHAHNAGYTTMDQIRQHNIGFGVPTILAKLAHIYPPDADDALAMAKKVNGYFVGATDPESIDGSELLAATVGLYSEPSSGNAVAVLQKFLQNGAIKLSDTVVLMTFGSGFRETGTVSEIRPFTPDRCQISDIQRLIAE